ncbi:response regulator [Pararhizobium sp. PWRC1-1]|uniref:response regulator n=1 Tax=Pararhizobium sp. PWRC1-1 TaxID=2804566 RepID=UPI003CFA9AE2
MISEPLIAVVDDDFGMRMSLDGLVRSLGYRTAIFSAAEGLLASDHAATAACIISDIEMPGGIDGIELASKLLELWPNRPVILISAFVNDKVRAAAEEVGAFIILKKPFVGETLIDAIECALSRQSA